MYKLFVVLLFTIFISSCRKDNDGEESLFYGIWVEERSGDSLQFYKKNNNNILAYNVSFNAALPAYTEKQYIYRNGKLSIRMYQPSREFYEIESFTWKQPATQFEIRAIELFPILSSSVARFTYRKIQ